MDQWHFVSWEAVVVYHSIVSIGLLTSTFGGDWSGNTITAFHSYAAEGPQFYNLVIQATGNAKWCFISLPGSVGELGAGATIDWEVGIQHAKILLVGMTI